PASCWWTASSTQPRNAMTPLSGRRRGSQEGKCFFRCLCSRSPRSLALGFGSFLRTRKMGFILQELRVTHSGGGAQAYQQGRSVTADRYRRANDTNAPRYLRKGEKAVFDRRGTGSFQNDNIHRVLVPRGD